MESITSLTVEQCRTALKKVIDPEIYQNIVDLGLVYGIDIAEDRSVIVTMTLTTPHCPLGPQIIENVRRELSAIGASSVDVNIVWTPPWTPDAMTPELKKLLGIAPEEEEEEKPALMVEPPPPPAKKKRGLFGWLFR
ncbi:MAG: metal-sulfur cluster assembly factor [Caldilinea sp.]|nr:metal-sulfur cluster assembly factor [Caldilinea sp.]MDW8440908.1 metal-sulfur cluster assembly factor [Caldilineaceae bacterium]